MYWTGYLNALCCADKRAHIKMKNGEEFDCTPDCLTYDKEGNEEMTVRYDSGELYCLKEDDIESVSEIG